MFGALIIGKEKKIKCIFIVTRMHLIKNQKRDIQIVIAKYALITVWPFYNGFPVISVIADALILPPVWLTKVAT